MLDKCEVLGPELLALEVRSGGRTARQKTPAEAEPDQRVAQHLASRSTACTLYEQEARPTMPRPDVADHSTPGGRTATEPDLVLAINQTGQCSAVRLVWERLCIMRRYWRVRRRVLHCSISNARSGEAPGLVGLPSASWRICNFTSDI